MSNGVTPVTTKQSMMRRGRPAKQGGTGVLSNGGNGAAHLNGQLAGQWQGLSSMFEFVQEWKDKMARVHGAAGERPDLSEMGLPKGDWTDQALKVLKERYLQRDLQGNVTETADEMCWRVAWELAVAEVEWKGKRSDVLKKAEEYYRLMVSRKFLPNSPTLMNAGKNNGLQYSACYVLPVGDSLEEIFDGIKYQAIVHQSGGGTGFAFSRVRPKGSIVKTSRGVASGPVSFMKIYNEATQQIKQGGTRRGANMGILRVDHPDVLEFIVCKDQGGITNFNISVAITEEFMKAYYEDGEYELRNPHDKKVVGKLKAREVFRKIAEGAWRTGDPGMIFIDRINHSPGNPIRKEGWEVESTNPCGEQPLYPFDACNLGSIFLGYFVKEENGRKTIDWDDLKRVTQTAVELLDSVIEMNPFPLRQIKDTVTNIRRIGLGVGGWADMLIELGIPYDSDEALKLGEQVMKAVNDEAHNASRRLAKKRGPFLMYKDSIYADDPHRNSTVTTIAPTGTISILAGASSGIEPLFAIAFRHIVKDESLDRKLVFVDPKFERIAKERGFYSEALMNKVAEQGMVRGLEGVPADVQGVFGTAHEVDFPWHVKMQTVFQRHTDNAVSKTINMRHDVTVEDIEKAYLLAWEGNCNGITVFRDGCKDAQVLNVGSKEAEKKEVVVPAPEVMLKPRPTRVEGATYKINTPLGHAFITVNNDSDGNPFEVFVTIGKAGSEVAAMAEALGRLISSTLRFGNHQPAQERAKELVHQLSGIGGSRSVGFGPNKVRSLPDAVAKAIAMHFGLLGYEDAASANGNGVAHKAVQQELTMNTNGYTNGNGMAAQMPLMPAVKRDLCPECKEPSFAFQEGCKKCYSCGYSEC